MGNMNYCRFHNTWLDVGVCLSVLREERRLSREEANAGLWMFEDILNYCRESGIIDSYDGEVLKEIFDELSNAEDVDDE